MLSVYARSPGYGTCTPAPWAVVILDCRPLCLLQWRLLRLDVLLWQLAAVCTQIGDQLRELRPAPV